MPPEKFPSIESESTPEQSFESANAVGARLIELGWTEEQLGEFTSAMETVADVMARGNEGDPAGKMNFELAVAGSEDGEELAEVTITGEGKGFDLEQLSALADKDQLFAKAIDETNTEFFEDQNKVILRWRKNRASGEYSPLKKAA